MAEYVKQLIGYVNENKNGDGHYLSIKNVSEEPIIIEPGKSIFLNRTPSETLQKFPKVPHYSKSVKVEDGSAPEETTQEEDTSDKIPF